jgi:hypothetical protein
MKKVISFIAVSIMVFTMCSIAHAQSKSELCQRVDQKPVLSFQQVSQADLVHYLVVVAGLTPPSEAGKTPEEYYREEVQLLVDNGYPPSLAETEADRLVTRRHFASVMYQLAMMDPAFAEKYGGLTDENAKINALVEEGYMYTKTGRIYREEILAVLCTKGVPTPEAGALEVEPLMIMGAELETPASPI